MKTKKLGAQMGKVKGFIAGATTGAALRAAKRAIKGIPVTTMKKPTPYGMLKKLNGRLSAPKMAKGKAVSYKLKKK